MSQEEKVEQVHHQPQEDLGDSGGDTKKKDSIKQSQSKPRGFYTEDLSQYEDKSEEYHAGFLNQAIWFLAKIGFAILTYLLVFWCVGSHVCSLLSVLLETIFYQNVVVVVANLLKYIAPNHFSYGKLIKMDPMDASCFISSKESNVNYINCSLQDVECAVDAYDKFARMFKMFPKLQYKLKQIGGDYYYEKMTHEEAVRKAFLKPSGSDKVLNCQRDIDAFIRDNMNLKCPDDGPQWRLYAQDYAPTDQDHLPEDQRTRGMTILKVHHSLCDGVSIMCMVLSLGESDYSRDFFIKSEDSKWYQELMIKILFVCQLPFIFSRNFLTKYHDNFITKRKAKDGFSGLMNIHTPKMIDFRLLKALSKKINVAINDIVLSSLSTAMHKLFKDVGDEVDKVNIQIPANIRFKFYPTPQDVKLENKFGAIPLTVPLAPTMEEAYPLVKQVSKFLKNSFSGICYVYGTYFIQKMTSMIAPRACTRAAINTISERNTLAFSNTPGPIKPFQYYGLNNRKIRTIQSMTYISLPGRIGLSLACISFCNSFMIAVSGDDNILTSEEAEKMAELVYKSINDQIKKHSVTLDDFEQLKKGGEQKTNQTTTPRKSKEVLTTDDSSPERESKKNR